MASFGILNKPLDVTSISTAKSGDRFEGGYDYEFVDGPPSDEYICLIYTLVAKEAQQSSCCGKIFCGLCMETLEASDTLCPNHEYLQYFPDKRAICNISKLKVYCTNKREGCIWKGEVCHAKNHINSCPYGQVTCPNQCDEAVRSMDLPKHLETQCPN